MDGELATGTIRRRSARRLDVTVQTHPVVAAEATNGDEVNCRLTGF
jgi:hypothetical protein